MESPESLEEWLTQPEGLATGLKASRTRAGMTGKQVADTAGWEQSKVSRIENGKQTPSIPDIETWARVTGATDAELADLLARRAAAVTWNVSFKARTRGGQAAVQRDYNQLVAASSVIRDFETTFVPGLLQTPGYAHAVLTASHKRHHIPIDDVDEAVAIRMERVRMVYEPTRRFEFIVAESALHLWLCPPEAMRAQLQSLLGVIGLSWVRFGIIPFHVLLEYAPESSVTICMGDSTVAVTEDFAVENWYKVEEHEEKVRAFTEALDLMWAQAVEGEAARDLIVRAAQALPA